MAEANYSSLSSILTEQYGEVFSTMNDEVPLLAELDANTEGIRDAVNGKFAVHGLVTGRNPGVTHGSTTDAFPTAGRQSYERMEIPLRLQMGRGSINGSVFRNLGKKGTVGAFDAVDAEMKGLFDAAKRDRGRVVFGDGTGRLATCGTTSNSTTVNLAATTTSTQYRQLQELADSNALLDVGTLATPTSEGDGVTITAVSESADTITVSSAIDTAGTDFLFRAGAGGDTDGTYRIDDGQKEATGLRRLVTNNGGTYDPTGGLYNVSHNQFSGGVFANSGTDRPITEDLLLDAAMDQSILAANGEFADSYVMGSGVYRELVKHLSSLRRNTEKITRDKGGTSGITWDVLPQGPGSEAKSPIVWWDRDCPEGELFGLHMGSLDRYEDPDGVDWFDVDGNVFNRVTNYWSVEFSFTYLWEFATHMRNTCFVIRDIDQS